MLPLKSPWKPCSVCPSPSTEGILTSRYFLAHSAPFFQHWDPFLCVMSKDLVNKQREAVTPSMTWGVCSCHRQSLLTYDGAFNMGTSQLRRKQTAAPAKSEEPAAVGQDSPLKTGAGLLQGCRCQCGHRFSANHSPDHSCLPATLSRCRRFPAPGGQGAFHAPTSWRNVSSGISEMG